MTKLPNIATQPGKLYVCGFPFDNELTRTTLILKARGPLEMRDHWNGDGGSVEPDEYFEDAMVREHEEETGIRTEAPDWQPFLRQTYPNNATVVFFTARVPLEFLLSYHSMTDEAVQDFYVSDLLNHHKELHAGYPLFYNLRPLIELALIHWQYPQNRTTVDMSQ